MKIVNNNLNTAMLIIGLVLGVILTITLSDNKVGTYVSVTDGMIMDTRTGDQFVAIAKKPDPYEYYLHLENQKTWTALSKHRHEWD